jgi:transcriptional regulator with XRE-family HTH domain
MPTNATIAGELGELFADIRRNLGLNQTEFAAAIGISRTYVAYIEGGRHMPSEDVLLRLSKVLPPALRKNMRDVAGARSAGLTDPQFSKVIRAARAAMLGASLGEFSRARK